MYIFRLNVKKNVHIHKTTFDFNLLNYHWSNILKEYIPLHLSNAYKPITYQTRDLDLLITQVINGLELVLQPTDKQTNGQTETDKYVVDSTKIGNALNIQQIYFYNLHNSGKPE